MNKFPVILIALIVMVLMALPSRALSPTRVGEKNFERGWRHLMLSNRDKAVEEFVVGADAFAEALAEEPRSRYTNFPSNLTKAGMTMYFAGRFEESIDAMGEAFAGNRPPWEAPMFMALSYGRLGDEEKTMEWLKKYQGLEYGQRLFSTAVQEQMDNLMRHKATIDAVAEALDAAMIRQFLYNKQTMGQAYAYGNDSCGGSFWWRYAMKPCKRSLRID